MYVFYYVILKTTLPMSKLAQIIGKMFDIKIILFYLTPNFHENWILKTITAKPNLAHIYGKKLTLKSILSNPRLVQIFSYIKQFYLILPSIY